MRTKNLYLFEEIKLEGSEDDFFAAMSIEFSDFSVFLYLWMSLAGVKML